MKLEFPEMKYTKDAVFSKDRKHRYVLMRIWNEDLPMIMFVGLNPSTASENQDDPTIRRVIKFAKDWGYGGIYMCNLFSYVTAYPKELIRCQDLSTNNQYLKIYASRSSEVLCAWGSFKEVGDQPRQLMLILSNFNIKISALQINKNGSPKHPLYVKSDIQRISFNL